MLKRTMARWRLLLLFTPLAMPAQEKVDLAAINRIKTEAFQNSKVMDHLFYLSDVYGPRVTNSPGFHAAASWVMGRLREYGLTNVHKESYPFGRSWACSRFEAHMIEPQYSPLIGFPMAWTPGTGGVMRGEPVLAIIRSEADFERHKGKLKGKIVLTQPAKDIQLLLEPLARRLSDEDLLRRTQTPDPSRQLFGPPGPPEPAASADGSPGGRRQQAPPNPEQAARLRRRTAQFLKDEGALLALQYGTAGDGGTVFATAAGSREMNEPVPPPTVAITPEHYNRIVRLLNAKIAVKLEFNIQTEMGDKPEDSYNVIGEIEGGRKKDEVVMLGAHLDSWHGGTGATDNGTGSSVAIEAVRILKSMNVKMDRTVRIALWSGEEQGLLGSIAYVKQHCADRADMKLKSEFDKISAYYNDDTGTGKFRGIGISGNDMARPIFEAWMEPLKDLGFTAITGLTANPNRAPGGTDHTSFEYVGVPGFGFLQDPMEYSTRTHHSNMDVYDRVQKGDMMQASAIMAVFVFHTATRDQMMPRKPMPQAQPWPARRGGAAETPATTGGQ